MARRTRPKVEFKHLPPRKLVLLLSCMDARLLDDTVSFMNYYNLENRYDHVAFAGAALGVLHLSSPPVSGSSPSLGSSWKEVFFHHLQIAIDLLGRQIKDIFILEHRDCGAYQHCHLTHREPYMEDEAGQALEEQHHRDQAFLLAESIRTYCRTQQRDARDKEIHAPTEAQKVLARERFAAWDGIHIKCFLMDLRGNVTHLYKNTEKKTATRRKAATRSRA